MAARTNQGRDVAITGFQTGGVTPGILPSKKAYVKEIRPRMTVSV